MLCILYVTSVGALLGVVGVLIERMLPTGWPRRWVWSLTIPLSIALPGYYRGHHSWSVTGALDQQTRESMGRVIHGASLNLLDPAWWARTQACDPIINQIWLIVSGTILIWGLANVIRVSEIVRTNEDRRSHRCRHRQSWSRNRGTVPFARAGSQMGARPARRAAQIHPPSRR